MKAKKWKVGIAVLILIGCGAGLSYLLPRGQAAPASSVEPIKPPAPGAAAPLAGWLKEFDQQRALARRITELQKQHGITPLLEESQRLVERLNAAAPEGCFFSEESRHFEVLKNAQHPRYRAGVTSCAPPAPEPAPAPPAPASESKPKQ